MIYVKSIKTININVIFTHTMFTNHVMHQTSLVYIRFVRLTSLFRYTPKIVIINTTSNSHVLKMIFFRSKIMQS